MDIIAHRGASFEAPENTLGAFQLAWAEEADGIECDVRLTKDNHVVCVHDPDLKRITGHNLYVDQLNLADIIELDAGLWKGDAWSGEPIPTLAEVLRTVPERKKVFIEVKSGSETVSALFKTIDAAPLFPNQISIISFNAEVIADCRDLRPEFTANLVTDFRQDFDQVWHPSKEELLHSMEKLDASGLNCKASMHLDEAFANELKERGFPLNLWTIDDMETAKYFYNLGAASITTNHPGRLRQELVDAGAKL